MRLFLLALLLGLVACSTPSDKTLPRYEQSLSRADSLVRSGVVDSAQTVRLLSDLHREYRQVKDFADGKPVRMTPLTMKQKVTLYVVIGVLSAIVIWLIFFSVDIQKDREHRRFTLSLSENEQNLRSNERELAELESYLDEMPLTDEMREEVRESLVLLMDRNHLLHAENDSLRTRLKEYENRPISRELEALKERGERIRLLDEQVQTLTSTLIDRDEVVERLRRSPKFLQEEDWEHLYQLANRAYCGFSQRLTARFPQLTMADLQLCLLMRLRFSNAQVATLIAVSPASVSQQKFRLKKRLLQTEEGLFKDGEGVDAFVWGC